MIMKRIIILLISVFCFANSFSQPPVVPRASQAITVSDANLRAARSFLPPVYNDTTEANELYPTLDSAGKIIFNKASSSYWMRVLEPFPQWVEVGSNQTAVTNLQFTDSSVIICSGVGVCDTTYVEDITIQSVYYLNDSTIVVCDSLETCDTLNVPQQILYVFQNGLTQTIPGVTELGGNLMHNTTIDTKYNTLFVKGVKIYDYMTQFERYGAFQTGNSVASFLHRNAGASSDHAAPDYLNAIRLGINYTGAVYQDSPSVVPGYMGDKIGYILSTNIRAQGSFGWRLDAFNAKIAGMFMHTWDTANRDAFTFFGNQGLSGNYYNDAEDDRIMTLKNDRDIRLYGYPSTRDDGELTKVLGTDADGNLLLGTVSGGGSSVTAGNGITDNSGTFNLGGTLSDNIVFDGDASWDVFFGSGTGGERVSSFNAVASGDINLSAANAFVITGNAITTVIDTSSYKPLVSGSTGVVKRGYWGLATPTLQQVITAGASLTSSNFITFGAATTQTFGGTASRALVFGTNSVAITAGGGSIGGTSNISVGDSLAFSVKAGVLNIDSLRSWSAISDTTYKKPMTWDTRNGRWEYLTYWPVGSGGSAPAYGTDGQIPFMNSGGTGFIYNSALAVNSTSGFLALGGATTSTGIPLSIAGNGSGQHAIDVTLNTAGADVGMNFSKGGNRFRITIDAAGGDNILASLGNNTILTTSASGNYIGMSPNGTDVFRAYSSGVTIGGTAAPTAKFQLPATTATAGTASLKLPSGTVLTSPEAGAVEADNDHVYWSNSSASRLQLDNPTFSNGLTLASNAVKLGGTLTENTTISGNSNTYSFTLSNISNLTVTSTGNHAITGDGVLFTLTGKLEQQSGQGWKRNEVTTNTTLTDNHYYIAVDATAGNVTITLPACTALVQTYIIKRIDNSGNTVTITPDGSDTIELSANKTLTSNESVIIVSDGDDNWEIVAIKS